jgi:hypothetical protein
MTQFERFASRATSDISVIDITYKVEESVDFRNEPCAEDVFVNETEAFNAWWEFANLGVSRGLLEGFLHDIRELEFLEGQVYPLSPDDEGYSFEEDCRITHQLVKENPIELFSDYCEAEIVHLDYKHGLMNGSWKSDVYWYEVRNNQEFWDWADKHARNLNLELVG